jgi:putative transposase
MEIGGACEVWSADITYIPMRRGFMYLVAVMDWFSRYVIAWDVSNSMESGFCVAVLKRALKKARPGIFNTDQGSQFTSEEFTGLLLKAAVRISMDGRGRALDNVFIERLWRSVKYEDIYLRDYADGHALHAGLTRYFRFYNYERPHSALDNESPACWHKKPDGRMRLATKDARVGRLRRAIPNGPILGGPLGLSLGWERRPPSLDSPRSAC